MKQLFLISLFFMLNACSIKNEKNISEADMTLGIKQNDSKTSYSLGIDALANNDTTLAERYFTDALQKLPWYQSFWPFDAKIHYHLATTYLRSDDFQKASKYYDKTAGLFGIKPMQVRSNQLALFEHQKPYKITGTSKIQIPFVTRDPLPVVKVSIEGKKPVHFFIDTGGEELILDKHYANCLGVEIVGEVEGEYAGNKKGLTGYSKIDSLTIGDMTIHNIPVQTLDLEPTNRHIFKDIEVHGIIGTRFLMHFLSTIDYKNKQLILKTDTTHQPSNKAIAIPFSLFDTHLIFARGAFNGQNEGLYFIDTGLANAGFLSSQKLLNASNVTMDWSKAKIGAGGGGEVKALEVKIDEVTLGKGDDSISRKNLKGIVFENEISLFKAKPFGFEVKGLISHEFFLDSAVTFDFEKMTMYIEN